MFTILVGMMGIDKLIQNFVNSSLSKFLLDKAVTCILTTILSRTAMAVYEVGIQDTER